MKHAKPGNKQSMQLADAKRRLAQSEDSYLSLFENCGDAIMIFNPVTKIYADCNDQAVRLYGYPSKKALLQTNPGLLSPPLQPGGQPSFKLAMEHISHALTAKALSYEWLSVRQDGSEIALHMTLSPIFFRGDRCVAAIKRDITQQKAAEIALKEEQRRLDYVFNATQDGIWDWDMEKDVAYCNKSYYQMLGYEPDHFPANDSKTIWLDLIHPDDIDKTLAETEQHTLASDEPYSIEFRMRCLDNSYKWILDRGKVVARNSQGEPTRMVGAHVDIDMFKKLEGELRDAKEAADASSKTKGVFLANMSHELRTPLNAVLGFSELLFEREPDPLKKSQLSAIKASGKSLLSLINDVLDLAKIEAGKIELQVAPISLPKLFSELSVIFKQQIIDQGLEFVVDLDEKLPEFLLLDETRLRQVLINLLSNAVKFTTTGTIRLTCRVLDNSVQSANSVHLAVDVRDSGKGIPPEDQKRVFYAFEQSKGQSFSQYKGTGLGLTISKHLVELMHGTLTLKSKPGQGSIFRIELREVEIPAAPPVCTMPDQKSNPGKLIFKPAKVLIVDDIDCNCQLLATHLKNFEFTIFFADNGEHALEKVREHHPDLILMDMRMPVMDGYQASKQLKNNAKTRAIPIIAITASTLAEGEEEIRQFCDSYMRKPVYQGRLVEEIKRFLPLDESTSLDEKSNLRVPSKAELLTMYEISQDGDMDKIITHLSELENTNTELKAFCQRIKRLAMEFKDERIVTLLTKYLES